MWVILERFLSLGLLYYLFLFCCINTIGRLVTFLQQAFLGPRQFNQLNELERMAHEIFKPWEMIRCLSKLAVHDSNKAKIIEKGALVEFGKAFSRRDAREIRNVAECLWNLAFDKNVRRAIKNAPGIIASLARLKDSEDLEIRKNVRGALWVINGENETLKSHSTHSAPKDNERHIFISYCWAEQDIVREIYTSLKAIRSGLIGRTFKGSALQAMADAVENASVVLICMSEKYKQSPNCRTEAEYTFKRNQHYIPLNMQRFYEPDGWLGAMLGARIFYDFSGKYPFDNKMQELLLALNDADFSKQLQADESKTVDPGKNGGKNPKTKSCVLL